MWIEINNELVNLGNVANIYVHEALVVFTFVGGVSDEEYNTSVAKYPFGSESEARKVYEKIKELLKPVDVTEE